MNGTMLSEISGSFGVSSSALSRHSQSHLRRDLQRLGADTAYSPVSLLERLGEIADAARTARLRAQDGGSATQHARATDVELKAISALMTTYGVTSLTVIQMMADAEQLTHAVARFTISNPEASKGLIQQIRIQNLEYLADDLTALVAKKNSQLERAAS